MSNIRILTNFDNLNVNNLLTIPKDSTKVGVNGSFEANTKSFNIPHPLNNNKKLIYGSLESPYHGIRLTGKDIITKDSYITKINLPNYISELVSQDNINIQLTNYKHSTMLFINEVNINQNYFIVKTNNTNFVDNLEFFWTFTAVRKDINPLVVET